ncbi:bet1-like protein At4g14600 [Vigna unguiculata]|uniref:bet1-like protein At4g14600 n=1 Tax=Vigna unguiculata TaxID=3917 RepID=UPI001015E70B|nr:bet1-like protein At4g14600 [Vigna unguiculata]
MSTNPHKGGSFYGDAAHYRSSEGLTTRPVASSDEIQLHIDPGIDFDDEITGLRGQVRRLRNVAEDIGTEVKYQRDFLEQVQLTMIKAQAGVKNNLRRLNKSIVRNGANHVVHVIVFALICFFIVYLWSKVSRK